MVGCNVCLNLFLMKLFALPEVSAISKSDVLTWPTVVLQILSSEALVFVCCLSLAFLFQSRKRDLV